MSSPPPSQPTITPAALATLAIYNPALGDSDETFHKQIVFYYSRAAKAGRGDAHANTSTSTSTSTDTAASALREEENEKLRQVGLAQGMVGFARSFSHTRETVDSIETDRARIVLHELAVERATLEEVFLELTGGETTQ